MLRVSARSTIVVGAHRLCSTTSSSGPSQPSEPPPRVLALDNTKAGMQAVDKKQVERVIEAASRGSSYYQNEERKAAQRAERIAKSKAKLAAFDALTGRAKKEALAALDRRCDDIIDEARASVVFGDFVHIDMDAFYASVEEKLHPELKGVPFGVGNERMLSTSNYEARKYGVRAGMAGFIALKLCPQLVFSFSGFEEYRKHSAIFKRVVAEYDAEYSSVGLDEVTMNMSGWLLLHRGLSAGERPRPARDTWKTAPLVDNREVKLPRNALESTCTTAEDVAFEIRARIYAESGLTASAGVGPTAAISKILSNFDKPDGQSAFRATTTEELQKFMAPHPIRIIAGVGRASEEHLAALGIHTCDDLFTQRHRLCHVLTPKSFASLLTAAVGCQSGLSIEGDANAPEGTVAATKAAKAQRRSVSAQRTFDSTVRDKQWRRLLDTVFDEAHGSLTSGGWEARQVLLKLKHRTFEIKQFTKSFAAPTAEAAELRAAFEALVGAHVGDHKDYRLVGCCFAKLSKAPLQETVDPAAATAPRPPKKKPTSARAKSTPRKGKPL